MPTKLLDIRAIDGLVAGTIRTNLDRTSFVCSARVSGGGAAANAIDGNTGTRWATGGVVVISGGSQDWFKVDCGASVSIAGIVANSASFANDVPLAGDLQTSPDDVTYTTRASYTSGDISGGILTKTFTPVTARYLKWLATALPTVGTNWWSIGEINITTLVPGIVPRVGGACTFSRLSTATQIENGGGSTTIPFGQVAVSNYVDPVSGLYVPTYQIKKAAAPRVADVCQFAYTTTPQVMTIFLDFYDDLASGAGSETRVFQIGDSSSANGPSLSVRRALSPNQYKAVHHNGTSTVTASTGSLTWAAGDRIRLRIILNTDGSCQIGAKINGAAEVLGTATGALTLNAAWNQLVVTLGADYNGSNNDNQGYRTVQAATTVLTAFPDVATRSTYGTRRGVRQAA
jgi:hypothetical protein